MSLAYLAASSKDMRSSWIHKVIFTKRFFISADDIITDYSLSPGAYEACFNTYTPGLVNWTIDPAHPTHQPLWSLLEMPSITWDADPGKNYTLIFWDSGALMLRGLYININGSDLTTGQVCFLICTLGIFFNTILAKLNLKTKNHTHTRAHKTENYLVVYSFLSRLFVFTSRSKRE